MDAVGEVQVIANGYTAENGRNNGGLINVVTKSGTNTFKGVGLVQRPPRQVQRERLLPQGEQPGEAAVRRQHLRLQLRRTGRDPGRDRQPQGDEEDVLLRVAGVHRRRAADIDDARRTCRPRSSAPATSRRPAITNGTHPADHRPAHRRCSSRATSFRPDRISPLGQTMLQPAADAQRDPEPAGRARSGRRTRRTT